MKKTDEILSRKSFLHRFYKGNKIAFGVAVFAALVMGVVNLAVSWLIQQLIDTTV